MARYENYTKIKGLQSEIDDTLRSEIKELLDEHAWDTIRSESKDINDMYELEIKEEQIFDENGTPFVKFSYSLTLI